MIGLICILIGLICILLGSVTGQYNLTKFGKYAIIAGLVIWLMGILLAYLAIPFVMWGESL